MKKNYFKRCVVASLAVIFSLSCSQFEESNVGYEQDAGSSLSILISREGIESQTRASATEFESGDQIAIYSSFEGEGIANAQFENVGYNFDGSDWSATSGDLRSDKGIAYDYVAYYPYTESVDSAQGMLFSIKSDQSSEANFNASDLMWASDLSVTGTEVELKFSHKLSLMCFKMILPTGTTVTTASSASMTISNLYDSATLDLGSGEVTLSRATTATITAYATTANDNIVEFEAYVVPQSITSSSIFKVTFGTNSYMFTPTSDIVLESGKSKSFELSFDENDVIKYIEISGMSSYITAGDGVLTLRNTTTDEVSTPTISASISGTKTTIELLSTVEDGSYEMVSIVSGGATVSLYSNITVVSNEGLITATAFNDTIDCFGAGTSANPYQVFNQTQLKAIGTLVCASNGSYNNKYYTQIKDITMSGNMSSPIGTGGTPFKGVYDGGGYTISGVSPTWGYKGNALFGALNGTSSLTATVKNLTTKGTFTAKARATGGVVGAMYNYSAVDNCSSYVNLTSEYDCAGGIVGGVYYQNSLNVEKSSQSDLVSTLNSQSAINAKITNCNFYGTLIITGETMSSGGVVGLGACTISGCANYGTITAGASPSYVGGVCGTLLGNLSTSFNAGSVGTASTATSHTGGVVGMIVKSSTIQNCYNAGAILSSSTNAGGIVGAAPVTSDSQAWKVTNCYNIGKSAGATTGGLIGGFDESKTFTLSTYFSSCYYSSSTGSTLDVANSSTQGSSSAKSNSDMSSESTYLGWDFSSTWKMSSTTPVLQSNAQDSDPALP